MAILQLYSYPLLGVLFLWGIYKVLQGRSHAKRGPYPPGPKPKFLIGNAFDIPTKESCHVYLDWEKKYNSKILHAEALGNHVLVLNDLEDADELLEKRAKIYSDRPQIPLLKLMGWDFNISLMPYNEEWRMHRKICQQNFRKGASDEYLPVHVIKVNDMLVDLLNTPSDLETHIKKLSIAIPLSGMYGYDLETLQDPCVVAAEKSASIGVNLLMPGANFVNAFPILGRIPAWVPGAKSVRIAAEVKGYTEEMKRIPTEHAKKRMAEGTASPSLVTSMLERKFAGGLSQEEETTIENIAYTVYGAGSGTTAASMTTFFYLMAKHRDLQRKAQAEIDQVIGSKRLPGYDDRPRLPYIEAIYREVMRIAPPMPLSVPHATSEDDFYKGYFIPKGTTVFPNIWAMNYDGKKYPQPDLFNPERFFNKDGNLNDDSRVLAYGFGRRVCVGQHIASSIMWLVMVSVLACYDIGNPQDENGNELELNHDYTDYSLVRYKINLSCSIKPRNINTEQLVSNLKMGDSTKNA